jgi:hypothetical protein
MISTGAQNEFGEDLRWSPIFGVSRPASAFPRNRDRGINRPSGDVGAESALVGANVCPARPDCSGGVAAPSAQFPRSMPFTVGPESWRPPPQPRRALSGNNPIATERRRSSPPELQTPQVAVPIVELTISLQRVPHYSCESPAVGVGGWCAAASHFAALEWRGFRCSAAGASDRPGGSWIRR